MKEEQIRKFSGIDDRESMPPVDSFEHKVLEHRANNKIKEELSKPRSNKQIGRLKGMGLIDNDDDSSSMGPAGDSDYQRWDPNSHYD